MFTTPNVPVYLDFIEPATGKNADGDELHMVIATFRIHPLTPELAGEIDKAVRAVLFDTKGELLARIKSVGFDLTILPQQVEFRSAPDVARPWCTFPYAEISAIKAAKHKDVSGFALTFKAKAETPDKDQLARLHKNYLKQTFLTVAAADRDLITEMQGAEKAAETTRPKNRRLEEGASDVTH
jgi:hypothetical protein